MARWGRSFPSHAIRPHVPLLPHALVIPVGDPVVEDPRTSVIAVEPVARAVAVEPVTVAEEMTRH
jgi:hypothetical protein